MSYTFAGIIAEIIKLINYVIPVLGALAIVYLGIGVIRYIRNEGEHSNRQEILWSLIALFVLFSVWGILRILDNTLLEATGTRAGATPYDGTAPVPYLNNPFNPH